MDAFVKKQREYYQRYRGSTENTQNIKFDIERDTIHFVRRYLGMKSADFDNMTAREEQKEMKPLIATLLARIFKY